MHAIQFIQDLAVIMSIAGVATVVCHRLRQPVVLGYILAGVVIGPHTPPYPLITDEETIKTLAELGVVFLLFSLGLEFSLRKLWRVGATAFVAAFAEIVLMMWLGYQLGAGFGWKSMDALFLGAMLAISSTTIIVKALDDLDLKRERFAQLVFGILIVEDILAIGMIALLSGLATTGNVSAGDVAGTVGRLVVFLVVALVIGILVVPRLLSYVARFRSNEVLLIAVLGLCFGFCLLVVKLDYSIALGAFVIGAIMAESRELATIERLIEPIRDLFSAIFFVAIGLLLDPHVVVTHALPIVVITIAVLVGKVVACGAGTFVAGHGARTSLRVGMGLAQIGEFSFIIATLGTTLGVVSDFLYPIAVAVSVITTLTTPYLIRAADPLAVSLGRGLPDSMTRVLRLYTEWLQGIRPTDRQAVVAGVVRRSLLHVLVNFCLVAAVFLGSALLARADVLEAVGSDNHANAVLWGGALALSLPFLVAAYRKLQALSMVLAEVGSGSTRGGLSDKVRRAVSEVIPVLSVVGMMLLVSALSASILPPREMLLMLVLGAVGLCAILWRRFIALHARLQAALQESFDVAGRGHGG